MTRRFHKQGQSPPIGEGACFVDSGASPPGGRSLAEIPSDPLLRKKILEIQANVNREAAKRIPLSLTHEPDKIIFSGARKKDPVIEKTREHLQARIRSKLATSLARTLENLK